MFRKLVAVIGLVAMLCSPALAGNAIDWFYGQQPTSTLMNLQQIHKNFGDGVQLWDMLGQSTTGYYANLTLTPTGTGWLATLNPPSNQAASMYQVGVANPIISPPICTLPLVAACTASQVAVDNNKTFIQGLQFGNSASLGPFTPSGTAGQSIAYLVEGKITPADITDESTQICYNGGCNPQSLPRDRANTITYAVKASSSATSPTIPTPDSGYISVASIIVPNGTAGTLSGATIAAGALFPGFVLNTGLLTGLNGSNNITISGALPTLTVTLASPAPTTAPSSCLGMSATWGLQYFTCGTGTVTTVTAGANLTGGGSGPTPTAIALASPTATSCPSAVVGTSSTYGLTYTAPTTGGSCPGFTGQSKTGFSVVVQPTATALATGTPGGYTLAVMLPLNLNNPTVDGSFAYCSTAGSGGTALSFKFYESFGLSPSYSTASPVGSAVSWATNSAAGGGATYAPTALPTSTTPGLPTWLYAAWTAGPNTPPSGSCVFQLDVLQRLQQ